MGSIANISGSCHLQNFPPKPLKNQNLATRSSSLAHFYKAKLPFCSFRVGNRGRKARIFACLDGDNLDTKEALFDLKLPRRRLLVQFTCNECGERTERLINPVAYERGTVFVQCAGCLVRHKLVDNLGLVVEYDLRDEANSQNIDAK